MKRRPTKRKSTPASALKGFDERLSVSESEVVIIFASNVKRLRKQRGRDQKAFGELIGLEQPHVSTTENAKTNTTIISAERIAHALGVDFLGLFKK